MKLNVMGTVVAVALLAGCVAPRPEGLQKDSGDAYVDALAGAAGTDPQQAGQKERVAVLTSTYADRDDQALAAVLDAKVSELLTSSSRFEIAERATLEALKFEEVFAGTDVGVAMPTKSDYVMLAKIVSGSGIGMSVDFRFYEVKTRKTVLSRHVLVSGRGQDIFEKSISEFAQIFADSFEPKVRVVQTRGNGMVARISRGLNLGLKPGMEIEFYEYDDSNKGVSGKRIRDTVGRGGVLECDSETAWVEVDDHYLPSVKVRQGDYVEIITDPSQRRRRNIFTRFVARVRGLF